jgi:ribonuclease P protein component
MFSKKQRIERDKIGKIIKNPDFSFTNSFLNIKLSNNNLSINRFSIVIPKSVEKSAVKRHFIKRKVVVWVEKTNLNKGNDFVFYIKNKDIINNKYLFDSLLKKCIID